LPAALRITRPGNNDTRTGAGTGPAENPPANTTTTFDVRLPIQAGDAIGLDCCADPTLSNFATIFAATASAVTLRWTPRLVDGGPPSAGLGDNPSELLLNADIEPDADHDGFGDETQDQCPTSASTQGACPVTPATAPPAKKKCKKEKRHSAESAKKKCKKKKQN